MEKVIKLKEFFGSSFLISTEKGEKLYPIVLEELKAGNKVIIDFENIKSTITAFFYAWYGRLFEMYNKKELKERIIFTNITKGSLLQIETVEDTSEKFYTNKEE